MENQKPDNKEVQIIQKTFSDEEKKKIVCDLKKDIKDQTIAWIKKWGSIILTVTGILSVIGISISLLQIRSAVMEFTAKSIAEKFAEPNIKSTLSKVAEHQAKEIIATEIKPAIASITEETKEELGSYKKYVDDIKDQSKEEYKKMTEEIEGIKKEIALFHKFLDSTKSEYSGEYKKVAQQVEILEERNKLVHLSDKAIVDGDSGALEELMVYSNNSNNVEIKNAARAEILRVKKFYMDMTRLKGSKIILNKPDGNKYENETIPTDSLLSALKGEKDWKVRARAAELLQNRKEKAVPEELLRVIGEDSNLDVRKAALDSFENITGYPRIDILDYKLVDSWWEKNKEDVEKKLESGK